MCKFISQHHCWGFSP